MWNKQRCCWQLQNHVWVTNFRRNTWKITMLGKFACLLWSYDMERHAKKCVERYCELANKTTQQLYKISTPCIDDHHFKEEELKSVGELSKLFWNAYTWHVLEDPIFYGQWTNLHECRKHFKTMQIGTVSRLRFCRRSWGFKICIGWNIVRFRKSYVCSNQLDMQETNFSFAQFNRIRNHFLGCMIKDGQYTRTWFMGSDRCSSSRKHVSEQSRTGRPVHELSSCSTSQTSNVILFPQTYILLIRKLCCMCLKTTKQWSRWS